MEEGHDFVRVLFPAAPTWIHLLNICLHIAVAIMSMIVPITIAALIWHMTGNLRHVSPGFEAMIWRSFLFVIWMPAVLACFEWFSAIIAWRDFCRWGRVSRVLLASKDRLSLSYLRWGRMRQKHWPASEITAIELRPLRGNLTWSIPAADLWILRERRLPLRFRLSSNDSELPGHIATRIQSLLGHSPQLGLV